MKTIGKMLIIPLLCVMLTACAPEQPAPVAATTMPVHQFASAICRDTPIAVTRLITEEVSCVHDYTLTVSQMRAIEQADLVLISGAGLEEFMEEALCNAANVADASLGVALLEGSCHHHHEDGDDEGHDHDHDHNHELDAHIWLSPENAIRMAENIRDALCVQYPEFADQFRTNAQSLIGEIEAVQSYAREQLDDLSSREIITFHDGFGYLAQAFDLEILEAIEEESGSEPSAQELIELIETVEHHGVCAIFTESNGSTSAASVISAETGVPVFSLDMAMAGTSWFEAMYHNIDTLKEALE